MLETSGCRVEESEVRDQEAMGVEVWVQDGSAKKY